MRDRRGRVLLSGLVAVLLLVSGSLAVASSGRGRIPNVVGMTRVRAEQTLVAHGLRAVPGPSGVRFAPVQTSPGPGVLDLARDADRDRRVTFQEPGAGYESSRGEEVELATSQPPPGSGGESYFTFRGPFGESDDPGVRYVESADDHTVTARFPAPCSTIDHADVIGHRHSVVLVPAAITSERNSDSCREDRVRSARLQLARRLGGRVIVAQEPARARPGLFHRSVGSWGFASARPGSRAIALYFSRGGDCGLLAGTRVRETRRTVRIRMVVGSLNKQPYCTADLQHDLAVVALRHPLGHRRIVAVRH